MNPSSATFSNLAFRLAPEAGETADPLATARPADERDVRSRHSSRPSLSCIVPCHNEARNLDQLLSRLIPVVSALVDQWEVILVDDGSTDDTPQVLGRWLSCEGIRTIELSRNFGKEAALTAGLEAAEGDVVVMLDADLQHEPELIPELLGKWREGADTVYAVRRDRADEGSLKRLGAKGFYALVNAADRFEVPPRCRRLSPHGPPGR